MSYLIELISHCFLLIGRIFN